MDAPAKQRIVGIVAIIALGVILIPLLRTPRPLPEGPRGVVIPPALREAVDEIDLSQPFRDIPPAVAPRPAPPAESKPQPPSKLPPKLPSNLPPKPPPKQQPSKGAAESQPVAKPQPAATPKPTPKPVARPKPPAAPPPAAKPKPAATPKPTAKRSPAPKPAAAGWQVQVASFAVESRARAERLRARLRARGYAVQMVEARINGRRWLRLRVGPYRDRAAAQAAERRIDRDFAVDRVDAQVVSPDSP